MPDVRTRLYASPYDFGGLFVELDQAYDEADYEDDLREFIPDLQKFHARMFEGQNAPDGTPWAPLAASTIARKGHDRILFETGRLGASLERETGDSILNAEPRYLTFGTDVPYAIFHDEGTTRMPQRIPVGMNEDLVDDLVERLADSLVEQLKG